MFAENLMHYLMLSSFSSNYGSEYLPIEICFFRWFNIDSANSQETILYPLLRILKDINPVIIFYFPFFYIETKSYQY